MYGDIVNWADVVLGEAVVPTRTAGAGAGAGAGAAAGHHPIVIQVHPEDRGTRQRLQELATTIDVVHPVHAFVMGTENWIACDEWPFACPVPLRDGIQGALDCHPGPSASAYACLPLTSSGHLAAPMSPAAGGEGSVASSQPVTLAFPDNVRLRPSSSCFCFVLLSYIMMTKNNVLLRFRTIQLFMPPPLALVSCLCRLSCLTSTASFSCGLVPFVLLFRT